MTGDRRTQVVYWVRPGIGLLLLLLFRSVG